MRPIDSVTSPTSFESVWSTHLERKKYLFGCKKVIAIPLTALIVLLSLSAAGFALGRQTDNTNYPFVDDPQVIGKWQAVDFVTNPASFNPDQKSWQGKLYLTEMVFIKGGQMLLAVQNGNGNLAPAATTWSKGIVINKQEQTASQYEIAGIDGSTYMFFEWKNGSYTIWHMKPKYYVLKKLTAWTMQIHR
jgi:bla regulator protein BlaR1